MEKVYLFYWMFDAQQGSERGGGQFLHYRLVSTSSIEEAFAKYIKFGDMGILSVEDFVRVDKNIWHLSCDVVGLELPYDVLKWKDFYPIRISTEKKI